MAGEINGVPLVAGTKIMGVTVQNGIGIMGVVLNIQSGLELSLWSLQPGNVGFTGSEQACAINKNGAAVSPSPVYINQTFDMLFTDPSLSTPIETLQIGRWYWASSNDPHFSAMSIQIGGAHGAIANIIPCG